MSAQPWSLKKSHQGPRVYIMYVLYMYVYIWYMHMWTYMIYDSYMSTQVKYFSFISPLPSLLINRISLCSPDWYGTCYINQVGLTLRDSLCLWLLSAGIIGMSHYLPSLDLSIVLKWKLLEYEIHGDPKLARWWHFISTKGRDTRIQLTKSSAPPPYFFLR